MPLPELFFSGVIVTNYLHRPLFQDLPKLLESGGVLIYQTFMRGNEAYGRPKKRDYLLERNELFEVFALQFDVLAFEQGYTACPRPAVIQSICARKRQ